ncbi:MAG: pyrimidine 5'-nucleotidase [Paracoccus sp. (in: a-proteobacteria)]
MPFEHITTWIFDLDNTLYPPEAALFAQIEKRMNAHVSRTLGITPAEADRLRTQYWRDYGTTLAGLMSEHRLDPYIYLQDVHDIDFSGLQPDPDLAHAIRNLPGRKIVHTNADRCYAVKVLDRLGLNIFDAIYGIDDVEFCPKPDPCAYAAVIAGEGFDPAHAAMFEDDPRNLKVPEKLGYHTVLVGPGRSGPDECAPGQNHSSHVQYRTDKLAEFLRMLV